MAFAPNDNSLSSNYHQTKILISFWCKWRLNPKFLIQPSEILPVELIETHKDYKLLRGCKRNMSYVWLVSPSRKKKKKIEYC